MRQVFFILTSMLVAVSAFGQNTGQLFKDYSGVKNALVNSDAKTAGIAIDDFYVTLKAEENSSQKDNLLKATEKLRKAGSNLEKQRAAFNEVSTRMWTVVKEADDLEVPVYYQYCPMKKSYWLSTEKEIKNPYYGASMLTCGKVSETKN